MNIATEFLIIFSIQADSKFAILMAENPGVNKLSLYRYKIILIFNKNQSVV